MTTIDPANLKSNVISFRQLLKEHIQECVDARNLGGSKGASLIAELITSLSRYREEGRRLFPVVYIARDRMALVEGLDGSDPIEIGAGPLNKETVQRALKHCAPLGEGRSWVVYMIIEEDRLSYGMIRFPLVLTRPTSFENLRRNQDESLEVLGLVQLADSVMELRGSAGLHRYIYLTGSNVEASPPIDVINNFLNALILDVPPHLQESTRNFYYRVVIDVMQVWHGTLAAVLPPESEYCPYFRDGVLLERVFDIPAQIGAYQENPCEKTAGDLLASSNMIRGMMSADGVTLLRSDGCVIGYNIFIQHPPSSHPAPAPIGGARRRTYEVLCTHVGKDLVAAFYRSQDGTGNCKIQYER
jgi:hypothetical protein